MTPSCDLVRRNPGGGGAASEVGDVLLVLPLVGDTSIVVGILGVPLSCDLVLRSAGGDLRLADIWIDVGMAMSSLAFCCWGDLLRLLRISFWIWRCCLFVLGGKSATASRADATNRLDCVELEGVVELRLEP